MRSRVLVASVGPAEPVDESSDDLATTAVGVARRRSAAGDEVVVLGDAEPVAVAAAAEAEDATLVVVVGADAALAQVRAALDARGLEDVEVTTR